MTNLEATIGEPFRVLLDISIPAPTTSGVASPYVLEVLAPFSTTGIFKVCSFEVVSVGRDLPCINKDDIEATFYSRATDGTVADRATLDLSKHLNIVKLHVPYREKEKISYMCTQERLKLA